jgi:hypothetical protein
VPKALSQGDIALVEQHVRSVFPEID